MSIAPPITRTTPRGKRNISGRMTAGVNAGTTGEAGAVGKTAGTVDRKAGVQDKSRALSRAAQATIAAGTAVQAANIARPTGTTGRGIPRVGTTALRGISTAISAKL